MDVPLGCGVPDDMNNVVCERWNQLVLLEMLSLTHTLLERHFEPVILQVERPSCGTGGAGPIRRDLGNLCDLIRSQQLCLGAKTHLAQLARGGMRALLDMVN